MEIETVGKLEGQGTTENAAMEMLKWKLWNNIKMELFQSSLKVQSSQL